MAGLPIAKHKLLGKAMFMQMLDAAHLMQVGNYEYYGKFASISAFHYMDEAGIWVGQHL